MFLCVAKVKIFAEVQGCSEKNFLMYVCNIFLVLIFWFEIAAATF